MEIWKTAVMTNGEIINAYEVSTYGNIRHKINLRNRKFKTDIGKRTKPQYSYKRVNISHKGIKRTLRIHSVICTTFHGMKPSGQQVRHLDGNCHNNYANNLKWGTPLQNYHDSVKNGKRDNLTWSLKT